MEALKQGTDTLFVLLGAIMVLAMHAGFAFLELGTVRRKNQVNALVKILVDFSVSTVVYFVVGFGVGSFRSAGVSEFMHLATACEMVKIAKAKGYVTDAGRLAHGDENGRCVSGLRHRRHASRCAYSAAPWRKSAAGRADFPHPGASA